MDEVIRSIGVPLEYVEYFRYGTWLLRCEQRNKGQWTCQLSKVETDPGSVTITAANLENFFAWGSSPLEAAETFVAEWSKQFESKR